MTAPARAGGRKPSLRTENRCDLPALKAYPAAHTIDAEGAPKRLGGRRFSVAVVAPILPGMDRIALIERFRRAIRGALPIVVLTACDELDT